MWLAPPPPIQTKYSLLYVCFVVLSLCLISRYCTHSGLFRFSSTFFKLNNSHWSPRIKDIPPLWNTPCHVAGYNQKSLATDHAEPTCVATHHARPTSVATHHAKVTSKDKKKKNISNGRKNILALGQVNIAVLGSTFTLLMNKSICYICMLYSREYIFDSPFFYVSLISPFGGCWISCCTSTSHFWVVKVFWSSISGTEHSLLHFGGSVFSSSSLSDTVH